MSISINLQKHVPAEHPDVAAERRRCELIVNGTPLGYDTGEEHEKLENFAKKVAATIRLGCAAEESID